MDHKIGKRAFKLFKQNMFTIDEVAGILGVDGTTLEREFRLWCGDAFVYPGVYLVGGWVDKIVDAVEKWNRVIVVGPAGSGKSINALHAARKISKNVGTAHSLLELEQKIGIRHPGIILVDDVDAMGRDHKTVLEKASGNTRIIATASKMITVSGYHVVQIKPPSGQEMQDLAAMKGWRMIPGSRNLTDLVKANVHGGGILKEDDANALSVVGKILRGEGCEKAEKTVIDQVMRNGYEADYHPDKVLEITKACTAAWTLMMTGFDPAPALSTIKKTGKGAAIMYRKGLFND